MEKACIIHGSLLRGSVGSSVKIWSASASRFWTLPGLVSSPLSRTECVELAELHNLISDPGYAELISYHYMVSEDLVVPPRRVGGHGGHGGHLDLLT